MMRARKLPWLTLVGLLACQGAQVHTPGTGGPGAPAPATDGGPPVTPPLGIPPQGPGGNTLDGPAPVTTIDGGACAEEIHAAEQLPVDLLLLVDKSGSMSGEKWQMTTAALASFARDPRSAGLGVGMSFFPQFTHKSCKSDVDCGTFQLETGPTVCVERRGCVPAGGLAGPPPLCGGWGDEPCAAGTSCIPVGICSLSKLDCLAIGQPCPGGPAGDVCIGSGGPYCRWDYAQAASCTPGDYDKVDALIRPLPAGTAGVLSAITRNEPWGGTPTLLAVNGALSQLRQHLASHPGHRAVLVLATDGIPTGCQVNSREEDPLPIVAALESARTGPAAITTYVIGVFDVAKDGPAGPMLVDRLAVAGGTNKGFVLSPTADLTQQLTAALNQIRGAVLPCEFTIPRPQNTTLDYGKVNVRFRGNAGEEEIPYVGSADRCDPTRGGWYYDANPATATPTRVLMCPATCGRFKAETTGNVKIAFGCRTLVID